MSEEIFSYLCAKLRPAMEKQNTNFIASLPVRKRVAIALWKLATNSEYRSIGHLFGVSKSPACQCVQDFCKAVCTLLAPEIVQSPDKENLKDMADYFENRWGLPQCVGAIDGSHIQIIAPQEYHTDYFNRKGWHSIILQGVVDGKGLFWNVNGGLYPVCTKNICGVNVGYYVLGDSAYPLQNWLLKPFPDNGRLKPEQQIYNKKTSRARVMVENAFGRRCLMKRNDSDIKLAKSMVITCCALHNLCESHGEDFHQDWNTSSEEPVLVIAAQDIEECSEIRQALMRHLNI
ncbi:uncharacterized protein [Aquarana catesbeiana]|uniref:uncharacterized protein n=1 Tax=Aquarana catesbeiana TaxID=8400 RepID=UPI003CCA62A4